MHIPFRGAGAPTLLAPVEVLCSGRSIPPPLLPVYTAIDPGSQTFQSALRK